MSKERVSDKAKMKPISLNGAEDAKLTSYGHGSRTAGVKKLMELADIVDEIEGATLEQKMRNLIVLVRTRKGEKK